MFFWIGITCAPMSQMGSFPELFFVDVSEDPESAPHVWKQMGCKHVLSLDEM